MSPLSELMGKRYLAAIVASLCLLLAACGVSDSMETAPEERGSQFSAGLIFSGDGLDSYAQNHLEGFESACDAIGLPYDTHVVVRTGTGTDGEFISAVEEMADAGCTAVFALSSEYEPFLLKAADAYPDIEFFQFEGRECAGDGRQNTHSFFARIYEARYLAGIAAGLRTQSNLLGYVASNSNPEVLSGMAAYYLGAKSVNPDVSLLVLYTGRWSDAVLEADAARQLLGLGCDVLSQHTDTDATARTAQANGAYVIGYNRDMLADAPDAALASVRVDWSIYYSYVLGCLSAGTSPEQDWCGGLSDNSCMLTELNPACIAPDTRNIIDEAAAGLEAGTLHVFAGPLHGVSGDGTEINLSAGEHFNESLTGSAPSFSYLIDGITVLP